MSTSSLIPKSMIDNMGFLSYLETGIAVRYILFSDRRFKMEIGEHLHAVVYGFQKAGPAGWSKLFWFETQIQMKNSGQNRFELTEPAQANDQLNGRLSEWRNKQQSWWKLLVQPKPFVGVITLNLEKVVEADKEHYDFSFYHGMLLERINAHSTMLQEMALKDSSMSARCDAGKQLRRRFVAFASSVRENQETRMHEQLLNLQL
jgi:hypothetical protein